MIHRALAFFVLSCGLFLVVMALAGFAPFEDQAVLSAGGFSITLALLYILMPVVLARIAVCPLCILLGILWVAIGLSGLSVIGAASAGIILFPFVFGLFILGLSHEYYGAPGVIVTTIGYITIWMLFARYQWRLLRRFVKSGMQALERMTEPVGENIQDIWDGAERFGNWIKDR